MNNEHLAAQSDIKNPRELKPPGGEAGENASHDPVTSHSNPASPKKIFVCSPYRPLSESEESRKAELEFNIHRAKSPRSSWPRSSRSGATMRRSASF